MTTSAKSNGIYISIGSVITLSHIIAFFLTMSIITKTECESFAYNTNRGNRRTGLNERRVDNSIRSLNRETNNEKKRDEYHYVSHADSRKHPSVWSSWSWWSKCSRTCGHGVRMRSRNCLVWTGSRYAKTYLSSCTDTNVDFHVCKTKDCSANSQDFRDYQCSLYNQPRVRLSYGGKWNPVFTEKTPCRLICENTLYPIQKSFGTVLDGTYCYRRGTDMCVHGECKKVGCDNHLDSRQKLDMCGICGGQNDTCRKIEGRYTERLPVPRDDNNGYNEMFELPAGATELSVEETSRNFLALMSANKTFELNGNYKIESSGTKNIAGTELFYERDGNKNESLRIVGPTKKKIYVLLLYKEHNKGLSYEYWMPDNSSQNKYPTHPPITRKNGLKDLRNHRERTQSQMIKNIHSRIKQFYRTSSPRNANTQFDRRPLPNSAKVKNHNLKKAAKRSFNDGRKIGQKSNTYHSRSNHKTANCGSCKRTKKRKELFCQGAFVSHISVRSVSKVKNQVRYDVAVRKLYRYTLPLMSREFIYLANGCHCPKLIKGKDYLVIGFINPHERHEIQLILPSDTYYRTYTNFAGKKLDELSKKYRCPAS
ncbi:ADAMTS-like protein 2 [Octopus bimaculoides]|nr:ADAMTS-like protein 2 [Octopus bimaculoides]|eukprot:XP_014770580.1 PREDICTED: ADAMTS-like protein 2 [Octopus bimaculoides]